MKLRTVLGQMESNVDQRFADNDRIRDQLVAIFSGRLAQVEKNTARIDALEKQMAAVVAALPKLKDLI